ncbi:MAG: NAD(+) diphosphatase [Afipia sp.]|nr:NAD(+) diphosphatase [Afipia sp.]
MATNDSFPLGQPGFVSHPIDRAAHLRLDDEKLFALETNPGARAYVIHKDSILVALSADKPRALLTLDEARKFGANPGTIFLGLENGAAIFGMGIGAAAAEDLIARDDVNVENLRAVATTGTIAARELSTIAMAKSLVSWHQRHGFCANCGTRTSMKEGGWKRECPQCKAEHFPRTDPVVIMLVTKDDKCLLGRQAIFPAGMWSCLAGFVEAAETIENAVQREILEESGIRCEDVKYYMTQPWPYPSSLMIGCTARATNDDIVVDRKELEDARWFTREEATAMLNRTHPDGMTGPHPVAIAHHLLAHWLHDKT